MQSEFLKQQQDKLDKEKKKLEGKLRQIEKEEAESKIFLTLPKNKHINTRSPSPGMLKSNNMSSSVISNQSSFIRNIINASPTPDDDVNELSIIGAKE